MNLEEQPAVPLSPFVVMGPLPEGCSVGLIGLYKTRPLVDFMRKFNAEADTKKLPRVTGVFGPMEIHSEGAFTAERFPFKIVYPPVVMPGALSLVGRWNPTTAQLELLPGKRLSPGIDPSERVCSRCHKPADGCLYTHDAKDGRTQCLHVACIEPLLGADAKRILEMTGHVLDAVSGVRGIVQRDHPHSYRAKFPQTRNTLALASAVMRREGYTSVAQARAASADGRIDVFSTKRLLEEVMADKTGESDALYLPAQKDREIADEALSWMRTELPAKPRAEQTDYTLTLAAVARGERFHERHLGLLISGIPSYVQERRLHPRKAKAPTAPAPDAVSKPVPSVVSEGDGKGIGGLVPPSVPAPYPVQAPRPSSPSEPNPRSP